MAWTEEEKPAAIAQRVEHAQHAAERVLLSQEPMFCFQTAVALHRWSCLAYMGASASHRFCLIHVLPHSAASKQDLSWSCPAPPVSWIAHDMTQGSWPRSNLSPTLVCLQVVHASNKTLTEVCGMRIVMLRPPRGL